MGDSVRFQHFEVLRRDDGSLWELGRGAMGITYKAFDTNLRSYVALKVINATYLNSEIARQRFLREARAAAAIRHPNVATVFHLGSEEESYFYVMEFIDGETVDAYMRREGAVPMRMALEIAIQVSRALGAAEKQGLVHRDIKPSNLMLAREDERDFTVKVIDFGLAKSASREAGGEDAATLTAAGFLGTPHFASPEQLDEREVDGRSDIYSLGVTLWFMLAGKTPFGGSLAQVMSQHLHRDPPFETLEGIPAPLVALLRRMMAKNPADRPQTPGELRRELEACLEAVKTATPAPRVAAEEGSFDTTILPTLADAVPLVTGQILGGQYRLLGETTASDRGRMFRAESVEDGRMVALLMVHPGLLPTSESLTRVEGDLGRLARLRAESLRKVLAIESIDHQTYLVLEWLEGPTLLDVLRARRSLSRKEALKVLEVIGEGLDALAAAGLACPDFAVHEVWLPGASETGPLSSTPKFLPLAFGPAGAVTEQTMAASPFREMRAGGKFATRPASAFVFVLGALAYEVFGGLRGGSSGGSYAPLPALGEKGNAVLKRALDPAQSYPSAGEFVTALESATREAVPALRPTRLSVPVPPVAVGPKSEPATSPPIASPEPGAPAVASASSSPPVPDFAAIKQARRKANRQFFIFLVGGMAALLFFTMILEVVVYLNRKATVPPRPPTPPPSGWATPSSSASPIAEATPPPTPTPAPTPTLYERRLAEARQLQQKDDPAGALAAYGDLARQFPDEKEPLRQLEMISAALRASQATLTDEQRVALQEPLEQAASLGVISAQIFLGEILQKNAPAEALKWFIAAGNQGQTEAMVQAGLMLSNGNGVERPDLKEAAGWFSKAASGGDRYGIALMGECLLYGTGVDMDPKRAVEMLNAAAVLNEPHALNTLGSVYRNGIGDLIKPNNEKAARFYARAMDLGLWDAQANLGVLYMIGEGVEKNPKKAVDLFKDGAEKNNAASMFYYAKCYEGGVTDKKETIVKRDIQKARDWYLLAAESGNQPAIEWCKKNNIPLANRP